ncbi:MAG: hypothetical protein SFV24_12020 [Gemmatimonadales bacterium]|nr:hypothetical protein [Gemmatimonadales bacterium]
MTDQDGKPVEDTNPDGSPKKDLRYTAHEDRNVRVERQLDGSGHLARGDVTKMSVLNFSSRHQTRTERDPDFTFRPAPEPKPAPAAPPSAAAATPPVAEAAPPAAEAPDSTPAERPSVVDKIKHFFGF